jgi:hypothetical protein
MFVTPDEGKFLTEIEKLINKQIPQFDPPWLVKREPTAEEIAAETAANQTPPVDVGAAGPTRLREATQRDELLESRGLRPVRRTLGSRFHASRKFRR